MVQGCKDMAGVALWTVSRVPPGLGTAVLGCTGLVAALQPGSLHWQCMALGASPHPWRPCSSHRDAGAQPTLGSPGALRCLWVDAGADGDRAWGRGQPSCLLPAAAQTRLINQRLWPPLCWAQSRIWPGPVWLQPLQSQEGAQFAPPPSKTAPSLSLLLHAHPLHAWMCKVLGTPGNVGASVGFPPPRHRDPCTPPAPTSWIQAPPALASTPALLGARVRDFPWKMVALARMERTWGGGGGGCELSTGPADPGSGSPRV